MFEERQFHVFEEGQSLCSKKEVPCVRTKTFLVFEDDDIPIFGRTDLRKGVSEAKFDAEADFLQNRPKIAKNRKKNPKIFPKKNSASKNRKLQIVRNAFSRSFAAIRAKFEGRTDVRSSTRESEVKFRGGL